MTLLALTDARLPGSALLTVDLEADETLALIGETVGVGEALAACLTGRAGLEAGQISFGDAGPISSPRQARAAIRPHVAIWRSLAEAPLNPGLPIAAALEEPLLVRRPRMSRANREVQVTKSLVDAGGDAAWLALRPGALSPAEIQTVALARAYVAEPSLILAIDPFQGLDTEEAATLINRFLAACLAKPSSVLMIGTDIALAAHIADRIAVLRRGEIVEAGSSTDIRVLPRHPYTQLLANSVPEISGGALSHPR